MQAKIFEASVDGTPYSSPIFIRRFMLSDLAQSLDNKSYLIQSNSVSDNFDSLDEWYGKSNYGKDKYTKDQMHWIGYIYRCMAITFNLSSKQVYRLIGARDIVKYFNIYHTFDIVDAAKRIADNIGYSPKRDIEKKAIDYMKKLYLQDNLRKLLGEKVTVYIDRPLGSLHPDYPSLVYTQNYGYIQEYKALDGEYQDAYVIGINEPIKQFTGKVIAIINRKDDSEDKLIVCDEKAEFTNAEIRKLIKFQEGNHRYTITRQK